MLDETNCAIFISSFPVYQAKGGMKKNFKGGALV
jgi:hypothetical protein